MLGQFKREEIVRELLNAKLIVKNGFDPIDISKGINWNHQHTHNEKTYSVYLHALEYVGYLVLAGQEYNEEKYFKIARNIILSWTENNKVNIIEHSWNEHAVSYRLSNLILFQDTVPDKYKIDSKLFDDLIIRHCAFLANDINYKPNNHGILMDESLFNASYYISDMTFRKIYKNIALNRVKLALYRDFSRKGLHSENSPEYHRMMMIVLNRFNELIKSKNDTLTNDLNHKLKKAKRLLRILLKPDASYPLVGDTSFRIEENLKKDFSDFIDYEAGLVIFQNENKENSQLSDYLYFKCGYLSKTHKHFDDLSLNLMLGGNDIFVDAGKYNYNKSDKIRQYIISPEAHSVPMVENLVYHPSSPIVDQYNLGIETASTIDNYKIVKGYNNLYDECKLYRTVVMTNHGHVFILDELDSEKSHKLIQNFNINEKATTSILPNNDVEIRVNNEVYKISVINNKNFSVEKKEGYYSHKFSQYEQNEHIRYTNEKGTKDSLICVHNENNNLKILEYDNKTVHYIYEGVNYKIRL